ncbi:scaffold attachment factor B2-like [Chrysoperla carnea]|uniref:scaffold attachment factor B2-like n=1 Tax=Chrysoperla carnea TaxID=189513 RepID=UPI001D06C30A|nr:scaffold attachment factor B2-like [Chrysoperla carnea]
MAKRVTLDVDSSIIEKNLLFTEQDSCELDSLFPKQEENAILTKPLPVPIKMSDEVNLQLNENKNDSAENNSTNLNTNNDNSTIENLELKNTSIDKKVNDDNTNNDNNSDKTDSNEQILNKIEKNVDNTETTTPSDSTGPEPDNHVETSVKEDNVKTLVKEDNMKTPAKEDNVKTPSKEDDIKTGDEEKKESPSIQDKETMSSSQNDETHDEIDITLEYDDVDHLLTDEVTEEKTKKTDASKDEEKNVSAKNSEETVKTSEPNESTDKPNHATSGRCLWVSGLSHTTRANDLKQHFVSQGRVIGAKVVSNSRSPGARCYGYIVMSTPEEAEACVKNLHHSKLLNRFISVQKAKSDKQSDNTGEPRDSPNKNVDSSKSKKHEDEKMEAGDMATNDELVKSESSTSIDKKKDSKDDASPKRSRKDTESSDKKHSKDLAKRRRESKERHTKKDNRDKKLDKYQKLREERERQRRIEEGWRIRDAQRRQREEAARLDRERQALRMERERLQREKMELLRLEKKELEKEREELKRQKAKIEEATRKKHESIRSERSKKRRERSRSRSPPSRRSRSPDLSIKISKKREMEKYKDPERHFGLIDKHKDLKYKESSLKDSYRGGFKDRHDFEYNRTMDPKYDRYPPEKKDSIYKPRDIDLKTDDFIKNPGFSNKRNDDIGFEPPPPRISTSDANHFNVLPMSQSAPYGGTSGHNRMLRDDFHNKDMFVSPINSSRSVDRVSDRFPIERHERLSNENMDMNHRSRGYLPEMDMFPKQDTSRMVPPVRQDRLDRDNIRVNRDDRHMDPLPIRSNPGRYPMEHERDFHHRDQWYLDRMGPSKRIIPPALPARGDGMMNRASWETARYDQSIRPPGVYSSSKIDRH